MLKMKKITFVVALFCVMFFAGCVSVQGLYVDPSFTYQSVIANNIGVGGVVSTSKNISSSQQAALSNFLQNALVRHFPGLPVMPSGDVVRALGASQYQAMISYYRSHGVVPDKYLDALYKHIIYMRYIAFARIEQDNISHDRHQSQDVSTPRTTGVSTISYTTTLSVGLHIDVYDVKARRIVWRGSVTENRTRSNNYDVPGVSTDAHESAAKAIAQGVLSVAGTALVDSQHSYPSAPSFNNLVQQIFYDMVSKFPKKVSNN